MKVKSKLHTLAKDLGVSLVWLRSHRSRYSPPEWAFDSVEQFNKWRVEWEAGKKHRFIEAMAKLRKPDEHKKAVNKAWQKKYLARPEVKLRTNESAKLRARELRKDPDFRARVNAANRARKEQTRARYHADPRVRIATCLRTRTRKVLNGAIKAGSTMQLIGCTMDELKAWLEARWQPGMTWQNYGRGWHIDHKRPIASFDLLQESEQRAAFHYTNLQPLWAFENQSKGDKWQPN